VQVHYGKGVATHTGPEPCGGVREDDGEASAGECIGQPLSRESFNLPGADAVIPAEGHTDGRASASACRPGVVEDPGMCGRSLRGNREISGSTTGRCRLVRIGKARSRSR
jgi:hypothetical protein